MASIKVKFRPSIVEDHQGIIYYQIIHDRKVRQIHSDLKIYISEWDNKRSTVILNAQTERKSQIIDIRKRIQLDIERFAKIEHKLTDNGIPFNVDDIVDEFNRYRHDYSLYNYMESIINKLKQNGKMRTAETYKSALNNFIKFRKCEDIMLDSLTSDIMESYEAWQRMRGVTSNTVSFYTRILRAVYNRAVKSDVIDNRYPFRYVYTGVDKTIKRALPLSIIRKIKTLDLSQIPSFDFARDMFLMSFYLRGMSFVDMAYLKKTDLRCGYIYYRRRKTGQQLIIKWTKEMQMLLDKYPRNESDYLLPIIRRTDTNDRCTYRNVGYNINHNLKKIAGLLGLKIPLTLYVARHSWASVAKAKGIPISVISEGMGHDSEATTQIYLASLDNSVVDNANSLILKSL